MQSNNPKPRGIKFLARSYLAAGLFILLINLIPHVSIIPELGWVKEIPGANAVHEMGYKMPDLFGDTAGSPSDSNTDTDKDGDLAFLKPIFSWILIGMGFTYIILGIALSSAKSWSIKIFSSMTVIFAVLAVFVGDLSLYVFNIGASIVGMGGLLTIFNNFIMVGAVLYPIIVDRYLHSSNVVAYFNSKALEPTAAPTAVAGYTHRSPF